MKLRCKIYAKYLDEILAGKKNKEYRQFESIVLTDENGREVEFDITDVYPLARCVGDKIKAKYPDVPWTEDRIVKIDLGKKIA